MDRGTVDNLIFVDMKHGLVRYCTEILSIRCNAGKIAASLGDSVKFMDVNERRQIEYQVKSAEVK